MRKRIRNFMLFSLICIIMSTGAGNCIADDYTYIDITNPFLSKIPIAISNFKPINPDSKTKELATGSSDLLSEMVAFSGYFSPLDRGAFLDDPQQTGIILSDINFRNWTAIGAELLVTGGVVVQGDEVEMELRLFDTVKGKLLIGKRYKGGVKDQRSVIRKFAGEIIYQLTGSRGVFDSRIAFLSTGSGHKEIYFCDFDGSNPVQYTSHKSITLFPAWSSDGKWLAYTSYAKGKPDLYIKNIREKRGSIIAEKGINVSPAWVPGEFKLTATLSFSGDQEIYLLNGSGKIIKRLTKRRDIDVEPTWSPDGKKFAFVSRRSGSPQIHIQDVASGRVERLTYEGRYNTQPSWSPKGDKIAYSGMKKGHLNIYVIDVDGSPVVQLTADNGDNESPTWSPDGSLIAFASTREGPSRIYVMTAYGTDQKRLLSMPGNQTSPTWSPSGVLD